MSMEPERSKDMATERQYYYRVAVSDSWLLNDAGHYLRNVLRYDCGHQHRTEEAAEECRAHLRREYCGCGKPWLRCGRHGRAISAKWYNSQVFRVDANGNHAPERL
jgi:hypothetical protein